jgi:hypothetical protein
MGRDGKIEGSFDSASPVWITVPKCFMKTVKHYPNQLTFRSASLLILVEAIYS